MKNYKKTLFGSLISFVVGTSCCWISSLVVWLGGIAFAGTIANFIESTQSLFIVVSILLVAVSIILYLKSRRTKSVDNKA